MDENPYRSLPPVDVLADELVDSVPRAIAIDVARITLDQARNDIGDGAEVDVRRAARGLARLVSRSAGTAVVNATGVLLHTNLGRAVWSDAAIERAGRAAAGFSNVEMDLEKGVRSRRGEYVARLLRLLTGAEDALIVNNNAAALLLALAATSKGKAVPVSRGEMIEIGGSYRLPEVVTAGGATLVEVGTTNRSRVGDYQTALQTHECGAILKVHPSNYRVEGFTEEATITELAELKSKQVPLLYDLGSGLIDETAPWLPDWIAGEPTVRRSLAEGADLVLFSGDKLLGGPQAGLVVGRADLVARLRSDPLARALRTDAITYAALTATLESYLDGDPTAIPFWRHALTPRAELRQRIGPIAAGAGGHIEDGFSVAGAGSAPGLRIPTPVLRIPDGDVLYEPLLQESRPVLTRRDHGDLVVDLRAVEPEDDPLVMAAIERCR